ncbi:MAG: hypothetical protein ABIK44_01975 [candidate division WOR-3 bacterium]
MNLTATPARFPCYIARREDRVRGVTGKLVDVEDEENGEHGEVWVK